MEEAVAVAIAQLVRAGTVRTDKTGRALVTTVEVSNNVALLYDQRRSTAHLVRCELDSDVQVCRASSDVWVRLCGQVNSSKVEDFYAEKKPAVNVTFTYSPRLPWCLWYSARSPLRYGEYLYVSYGATSTEHAIADEESLDRKSREPKCNTAKRARQQQLADARAAKSRKRAQDV